MSTRQRLRLRTCTRPTPSPRAVMQTGCKNARASHAAAGRLSPGGLGQWSKPVGNDLSRACLGAAPPHSFDGYILARGQAVVAGVRRPSLRWACRVATGPVWTGSREWFSHSISVIQSPNHQSKPANRG